MKKLDRILYALLIVLMGLMNTSCKEDASSEVVPNGIILKFALVDPNDKSKRIECEINDETQEIVGYAMSGMDVSPYVMDFQLGNGVESLYKNGVKIPSTAKLELRSQSLNKDINYKIKISQQDPIAYFKIYNNLDTIPMSINNTTKELTAYFPSNLNVTDFKTEFGLGKTMESNLVSGNLLTVGDSVIKVRLGNVTEVSYKIKFNIVSSQDLPPLTGNVFSTLSGIAFKPTNVVVDATNNLVTANVAIGGNPIDKDSIFLDFANKGYSMDLLFGANAAGDVLRNKIKVLKVDAVAKTVDFYVEYGFRYSKRRWTYRYTFNNSISYTNLVYAYNGPYQFYPEFIYLVIAKKRYMIELATKPNSSTTVIRDLKFYQAKSEFYDLTKSALSAFRAYIPFDADLSKAHLEFRNGANYQRTSVDPVTLSAMPALNNIVYKSTGVVLRFLNTDFATSSSDLRFAWNIKIVETL